MSKATRVSMWRQTTGPTRTPVWRARLAVNSLENRALPSAALADEQFVGPRLDPAWLATHAPGVPAFVRPGSLPTTGLAGTPALGYTGPSGDQIAANSAFDQTTGRGLPGNKSRISDDLLRAYNQFQDAQAAGTAFAVPAHSLFIDTDGTAAVRITARDPSALEPALVAAGLHSVALYPDLHFIEGLLPLTALPAVEALAGQGLFGVTSVAGGSSAGNVTSQADWTLSADRGRTNSGVDGSGVRVGVLSDSYNKLGGAAGDVASGDLPAGGVQLVAESPFATGNTDEGRGMLQLIHDVAPGAALAFATAYGTEGNFAANINALANPAQGNCRIIVDDFTYFDEPMFQHGTIAQAVENVFANRNVAYYSSAGNFADQAWESASPQFGNDPTYGTSVDFDPGAGVDTRQRITLANNQSVNIELQWDDPFYTANGVDTDLDIRILNAAGTQVASSLDFNVTNQTPKERVFFQNTTGATAGFDIVINKFAGPNPGRVKWVNYGSNASGNVTVNEFATNSSTVTPHAAIFACEGVAAVPYFNQQVPEGFTSKGGNVTLFTPNGTPQGLSTESGPYEANFDGTNTTFFGGDVDNDTFPNFFGTSAAAPHSAAVAALVLQQNSGFTGLQIETRILAFCDSSINGPGYDVLTGNGLVNAQRALFGTAADAAPTYTDGFEGGALGANWETYATGPARVQVRNNAGPAAGTFHLTLDTEFGSNPNTSRTDVFGLNEAILHVNLAGVSSAKLSFQEREWSDGDDAMPASFTGHGNFDGVAFSADGSTWFRLVSLTGAASTNAYQAFNYDLVAAAASAGVALTSDTRIKFQRYGNDSINPGTNNFDGIGFDEVALTRGGQLIGRQVNDVNGNGSIDGGEGGLAGWRVYSDPAANGLFDHSNGTTNTITGPIALPDLATVNATTNFSGVNGPIVGVEVSLDITHTFDGDLTAFLISPTGVSVQLLNRNGSGGDNFILTTIADDAYTPVGSGGAPFSGRYRPTAPLSAFNGLSDAQVNGTWTLRIIDNAGQDFGTLNSASITLYTAAMFSTTTPVAIPDRISVPSSTVFIGPSTVFSPLNVGGVTGPLNHVSVTLNITHTFDGDLTVFLVGPTGARVQLLDRNGGGGDNFVNTTFDDFAATAIGSGAAPFTGTFRPIQPLGQLTGLTGAAVNGTWLLEIHDNAGADIGTLTAWSLTLETGDPYAITDANGDYALNNLSGSPAAITEQHQPGWHPTFPPFASYYVPDFANGASYSGGNFLVQADATAPTVTAITPVGPTTTNANSVQFNVTFSEPVIRIAGLNTVGLGTDNFAVSAFGLTGAAVAGVTGSGANYTVTVNTGTGDGGFTLAFGNSIDVVDFGYNAVGNVGFASSLVTVDRTPPAAPTVQVNDGNAQRSAVRSLRIAFGEVITFVGAGSAAFQLTDNNNVVVPGVTLNVSPIDNSSGSSVVTITFSGGPIIGGSLADGRYRLRTLASQVRDAAGNGLATDAVFNFHRLYGDVTGDATVNAADFGPFRNAFGTSTGNSLYRDFLDFNFDGTINAFDFGQFRNRFGVSLP